MLRFGHQATERVNDADVRVITINCNIGSPDAILETQRFAPDIVLVQESPGASTLSQLSQTIFGDPSDQLCSTDASIICRGAIEVVMNDPSSHFQHAVVTLPEGDRYDVISLRLSAPVFRLDPFSSGFWNDHLKKRQQHRQQIQEIMDHLKANHVTKNWIVGGDFNLPGGSGALSPLAGLADSFSKAGSGWCNTGTSDYPLFRVDQIWLGKNLEPKTAQAYATENSDHRMFVVNFSKATPQK